MNSLESFFRNTSSGNNSRSYKTSGNPITSFSDFDREMYGVESAIQRIDDAYDFYNSIDYSYMSIEGVGETLKNAGKKIWEFIKTAFKKLWEILKKFGNWIKGWFVKDTKTKAEDMKKQSETITKAISVNAPLRLTSQTIYAGPAPSSSPAPEQAKITAQTIIVGPSSDESREIRINDWIKTGKVQIRPWKQLSDIESTTVEFSDFTKTFITDVSNKLDEAFVRIPQEIQKDLKDKDLGIILKTFKEKNENLYSEILNMFSNAFGKAFVVDDISGAKTFVLSKMINNPSELIRSNGDISKISLQEFPASEIFSSKNLGIIKSGSQKYLSTIGVLGGQIKKLSDSISKNINTVEILEKGLETGLETGLRANPKEYDTDSNKNMEMKYNTVGQYEKVLAQHLIKFKQLMSNIVKELLEINKIKFNEYSKCYKTLSNAIK